MGIGVDIKSKEHLIDDLERRIAETINGTPTNPLILPGMYDKCVEILMQVISDGLINETQIAITAVEFNKFYKNCSEL